jgi:diaminopimelate decarboxylase
MRAHPAGPRHAEQVGEAFRQPAPSDQGALNPVVWPTGAGRDQTGGLVVAGHSVVDLARVYGTPLFVMDEADVRARARGYRAAFDDVDVPGDVYYAAKAFLTTAVARWMADEGLGLDVASGGELTVALRAGFPAGRILFHGNNKSVTDLVAAVEAGVGRIVVDSFVEIDRLSRLCAERAVVQPVLVRVTVGVEAHTHEFIATAHEDQKFGFSLAGGDAHAAVAEVLASPALQLLGVHSHIGSQIFDTSGFEVAAHRSVGFLAEIRDRHGVQLAELNLGGGLGIAYVDGDDPTDVAAVAESLRTIVVGECRAFGLAVPRLAVEPGRAVVGPSTVTVYEVGTIKPVALDGGAVRTYVSVDGGMSDNVRTALYSADYTVTLASRAATTEAEPAWCRVVGMHCESGDVVARETWLPSDLAPGDLVAVAATGAYCRSMASSYNLVGRPPVVSVIDGEPPRLLLRRETVGDLLRLDPELPEGSGVGGFGP